MKRRLFLQSSLSLASVPMLSRKALSANDRITVAVMGVRGRGNALLHGFASQPDVELKYVCDVDSGVLARRVEEVGKIVQRSPQAITDFRIALDDPAVDALVIGTPDHWHAIPTILACQAGKDVYVEKPDGHNMLEGRTMVAAMRKYKRIVQLGTQSRSGRHFLSAMEYIRQARLGSVRMARAWESARQSEIGSPPDSQPPEGVDYDYWLGPAPLRPFNPNRFHGSWRWFFDYGTGDLGNDGVHRLDVARWALSVAVETQGEESLDWPKSVSAQGGKYYFYDDQQWPDTLMVNYEYENGYLLTYEMRLWTPYPIEGAPEGAALYGDNGYIVIANDHWKAYDDQGKLVKQDSSGDNTGGHIRNFLECMRNRLQPVADLEEIGHPSSALCHMGNAAWRAGRVLHYDPNLNEFTGDTESNLYLSRSKYREPWSLPKV